MIAVVTGQPGSGKTYYTCRLIEQAAREGRFVATNVKLRDGWAETIAKGSWRSFTKGARARRARELRSRVVYVESMGELASLRLDTKGWEKKLEGRGIAVFDEAGEELDSREWNSDKARRKADNMFLKQHRKRGWDVYLIAQEAEQLDTRARGLAEYEITLRNLKRYKVCTWLAGGFPVWPFGNLFVAAWRWRAIPGKDAMKREWFTLSKRIAGLYDTHQIVYDVDRGVAQLPASDAAASAGAGMVAVAQLLAAPSPATVVPPAPNQPTATARVGQSPGGPAKPEGAALDGPRPAVATPEPVGAR